jgi:hypothetical protein
MRIEQKEGTRGSLRFIQQLVSRNPDLFHRRLQEQGVVSAETSVGWVSPRPDDAWAEYRDAAFLERIGHAKLAPALKAFWPARGPQWDGLCVAGDTVLLVEAKAHVGEMASSCTAEAPSSVTLIEQSLGATKQALGVDAGADWMNGYYQLANRLAHLWFLRARGVDARLVLLQFTGETGMPTASSPAAYHDAFDTAMKHLGFDPAVAIPGVVPIYIDVAELGASTSTGT